MKHALLSVFLIGGLALAQHSFAADAPAGLAYKGINIQLGGFLASETVYRTNSTGSVIGTSYNKLPFYNSSGYGISEFRGTERQSRFSLLATGDVDPTTHLTGYYELDFLGTSPQANANESNSYTPRTRHVYLTMDWEDSGLHILAGQSWSLATLNAKGITPRTEKVPGTIDAQYEVGFDWTRQWQFRVVKDWDKTFWLALSVENAQTVGVTPTAAPAPLGNLYQVPAGGSLEANQLSMNSYPDLILKFAFESEFGHYEIYNLARNFESRYGGNAVGAQTNKQSIWTDSIGAGATVPIGKILDISLSGLYGKGISRYGTSQLADATYASDGSLEPLNAVHYLLQVEWHAAPGVEAYAAYGQETVSASSGAGSTYGYGDGSVTSNSDCTTLGGTCAPELKGTSQINVGAWWSFYKGDFGAAKLGAQYSHTALNTFADAAGFAPSTAEDMVFTSLRYYPF